MKLGLKAAVFVVLTSPAALLAQHTGVSHPEDVPVTTSPDGIAQPVVYEPTPAAIAVRTPELKPRAASAATTSMAPVQPAASPVLTAEVTAPTPAIEDDTRKPLVLPAVSDGQIVERVAGPANELPIGAMLKVRLLDDLSTGSTAAGTEFRAELIDPMERDGHVLLPAGSLVRGRVTEVHGGKRFAGTASMHLMPTSVVLPDGTKYALQAQVIDTDLYKRNKVDAEGTILRGDHWKGTAAGVGLATGSGAAAGAMFGGWPGALIGAGVSAGISTVVWLRQDHQAELPAGTGVTLQLNAPLAVGTR